MGDSQDTCRQLLPRAIFGINGKVENGVRQHPVTGSIIFALGNKIGIADYKKNTQEFVAGHTNTISCLDLSKSGKYMASGQINHMGFRGYVIIWDYDQRKEISRHDLHKVSVQAICFTAEDRCVVSIGGVDDGSVIVFDMEALWVTTSLRNNVPKLIILIAVLALPSAKPPLRGLYPEMP